MPDLPIPSSAEVLDDRRVMFDLLTKILAEINALRARVEALEP